MSEAIVRPQPALPEMVRTSPFKDTILAKRDVVELNKQHPFDLTKNSHKVVPFGERLKFVSGDTTLSRSDFDKQEFLTGILNADINDHHVTINYRQKDRAVVFKLELNEIAKILNDIYAPGKDIRLELKDYQKTLSDLKQIDPNLHTQLFSKSALGTVIEELNKLPPRKITIKTVVSNFQPTPAPATSIEHKYPSVRMIGEKLPEKNDISLSRVFEALQKETFGETQTDIIKRMKENLGKVPLDERNRFLATLKNQSKIKFPIYVGQSLATYVKNHSLRVRLDNFIEEVKKAA